MNGSAQHIYQFSNGIRIERSNLLDLQIERYREPGNPNLHEPVEEKWMGRLIERLGTASPTFLDVGAGVGYYCVLVKKLRPPARVIAVEALPRHARALRSTLVLNGLEHSGVELIEAAVAPTTGRASFADLDYGSQLTTNSQDHPGAARIEVPTLSLADLIAKTGPIDLMKMDIQGTEQEVLAGSREVLSSGQIQSIILGTHGPAAHDSTRAALKECYYHILFDDPAPPMQPDGLIVASRMR